MKKKLLRLTFLLLTVAIVFSSCLGDTENKIEVSSDYACVFLSDTYQKYAYAGSVGTVYSDSFKTRSEGTILIMGYKITGVQSGIPTLENVDIKKEFKPSEHFSTRWGTSGVDRTNEIYPSSVEISKWSPYAIFMDRWLFAPSFKKIIDGTVINGFFYYDPNNQDKTTAGVIVENRLILDVVFTKTEATTGKEIDKTYEIVSNFQNVRSSIENGLMDHFKKDASSQVGTPVYLKIRYRVASTTDPRGYEDKYVGDFSSSNLQFIISK